MSLDRRLHHAARELRELAVDDDPSVLADRVVRRTRSLRRAPVAAVPVLFAVGGLVIATGAWQARTSSIVDDAPAVERPDTDDPGSVDGHDNAPGSSSTVRTSTHDDGSYDSDLESELIAGLLAPRTDHGASRPDSGTDADEPWTTVAWGPI